MIDVSLMAALLRATRTGARVLFVGDPAQLPPVSAGRPFADFSLAGVPTGTLTQIHRHAGSIPRCAHAVRNGRMFEPDDRLDEGAGKGVRLTDRCDEDTVADTYHRLVGRGYRPDDIQVVVGTNRMRAALNLRLQDQVNARGRQDGGQVFRRGDRVICIENGIRTAADGSQPAFVANGEIGVCVEAASKKTVIRFDDERVLVFPHPASPSGGVDAPDGERGLRLAYAITCHKSQGNQFPAVILAVDRGSARAFDRCWLYTGMSRARKVLIVCGARDDLGRLIRKQHLDSRKTFLAELIEGGSDAPQAIESLENVHNE
jgi:exodeoxyribonuclease V alpha subunit